MLASPGHSWANRSNSLHMSLIDLGWDGSVKFRLRLLATKSVNPIPFFFLRRSCFYGLLRFRTISTLVGSCWSLLRFAAIIVLYSDSRTDCLVAQAHGDSVVQPGWTLKH